MRIASRLMLVVACCGAFCAAGSCQRERDLGRANAPPPSSAERVAQAPHALHNVHRIDESLISGGVPEGDAGFDELRAMSVKTIISVDGAAPDVQRAAARGMRYVHVPITYAQVTAEQQLELARAIRDLPGPVYLHCHHGKHRGPAAAAAASVVLGKISAAQGVAFMQAAGTAPSYAGLYECVARSKPATIEAIDAAPDEFPPMRHAHGIVAAMIEVDQAFEHLQDIRAAGWSVPPDHPDLVPAAEAGRLTDNLRFSHEDPRAVALGDDFLTLLNQSIDLASALEEAIVRDAPRDELEAAFKQVQASCKDCHAAHRDRVREDGARRDTSNGGAAAARDVAPSQR